eukprot:scaffold105199_cov44-Prasinocladus_malaysianus.AAC.1
MDQVFRVAQGWNLARDSRPSFRRVCWTAVQLGLYERTSLRNHRAAARAINSVPCLFVGDNTVGRHIIKVNHHETYNKDETRHHQSPC